MKEEKDWACYLDMAPGLHGIDYPQKFVKAPMSLHPPHQKPVEAKFEGSMAMKITMGE